MRFDIITIFPKIFDSYFNESILKQAQKKGLIKIRSRDLRRWTTDKHNSVDDRPYGGGAGMVLKVDVIFKAVTALKKFSISPGLASARPRAGNFQFSKKKKPKRRVILFSAKGKQFAQADARRLAKYDQIILICGRYEGVDERVAEHIADEEVSVGNFVLTGGEIPAMIVIDAVSRLIPGVLGKEESLAEESFGVRPLEPVLNKAKERDRSLAKTRTPYLEYPQYTRPEKFRGWKVPAVLLSGDHKKIAEWREKNHKTKNM